MGGPKFSVDCSLGSWAAGAGGVNVGSDFAIFKFDLQPLYPPSLAPNAAVLRGRSGGYVVASRPVSFFRRLLFSLGHSNDGIDDASLPDEPLPPHELGSALACTICEGLARYMGRLRIRGAHGNASAVLSVLTGPPDLTFQVSSYLFSSIFALVVHQGAQRLAQLCSRWFTIAL